MDLFGASLPSIPFINEPKKRTGGSSGFQSGPYSAGALGFPDIDIDKPFGIPRPTFEGTFTKRLEGLAGERGPSAATRFTTEQAIRGAESGTQSAISGLTMRGGLTGGARERILALGAGQRAQAQSEAFGRGMGMDELRRQQLMQDLDQQKRQFAMEDFKARLAAAAANRLAEAQARQAAQTTRSASDTKFFGIF